MTHDAIAKLNAELAAERLTFAGLRKDVAATLAATGPNPDTPDYLLSHAEEFGLDAALEAAASDHHAFELSSTPPKALLHTLAPKLAALVASSRRMDNIVSRREDLTPGGPRTYIMYGREFTFDEASKTMRFADSSKIEQLEMITVMPGRSAQRVAEPDHEPRRDR